MPKLSRTTIAIACIGIGFGLGSGWANIGASPLSTSLERRIASLEARLLSREDPKLLSGRDNVTTSEKESQKGWRVYVFPPVQSPHTLNGLRTEPHAGSFIHTGSWIDLSDHEAHEDVFLSGAAALQLRGNFSPESAGEHILAIHMNYRPTSDFEEPAVIVCYASVNVGSEPSVVKGKLTAGSNARRAAIIGETSVFLRDSEQHLVDAVVSCILPKEVSGKHISLRICVRKKSESRF